MKRAATAGTSPSIAWRSEMAFAVLGAGYAIGGIYLTLATHTVAA